MDIEHTALGRALLLNCRAVLCEQRRASGRAELCARKQDGKVLPHGWESGLGHGKKCPAGLGMRQCLTALWPASVTPKLPFLRLPSES